MTDAMKMVGSAHGKLVHQRRVRVLAATIAPLLKTGWSVLDVGCGDGRLASLIAQQVENVHIEGYETLMREGAPIPVREFDGMCIPVDDGSVDAVMMVDVLHHTDDPMVLLREAARVASKAVIIKDHRMSRPLAGLTLRFMDWVGNRAHGVALPYNYWPEDRWLRAWDELNLQVDRFQTRIGLYPWPANWMFELGLHFVARLRPGRDH